MNLLSDVRSILVSNRTADRQCHPVHRVNNRSNIKVTPGTGNRVALFNIAFGGLAAWDIALFPFLSRSLFWGMRWEAVKMFLPNRLLLRRLLPLPLPAGISCRAFCCEIAWCLINLLLGWLPFVLPRRAYTVPISPKRWTKFLRTLHALGGEETKFIDRLGVFLLLFMPQFRTSPPFTWDPGVKIWTPK